MDVDFVARRITELRIKKGVAGYQMSREIGHGRNYIQNISAGRARPSLTEFLYICEYLGVTPSEFFDEGIKEPVIIQRALKGLKKLDAHDLEVLIGLIDRLNKGKEQ